MLEGVVGNANAAEGAAGVPSVPTSTLPFVPPVLTMLPFMSTISAKRVTVAQPAGKGVAGSAKVGIGGV